MRTNITLALVALVGMLWCSGCATPGRNLSKLQGTWVGKELGSGEGECRMTIAGDSLRFQGARRQEWYVGKLTLIPHTKPEQAAILVTDCGFPQYVKRTAHAIYRLEGKTLTIAGDEPGNPAVPTAFEHNATSHTRAFVFTKQ